jgi:hypothetical protein
MSKEYRAFAGRSTPIFGYAYVHYWRGYRDCEMKNSNKHAIPLLYAPLCKTGEYPMFIYINLCNKLQIYTQYIDVRYSLSITRGK